MKLVIVESPTKAKTISKFLPKGYKVESSYGHVRDLPIKSLGVDVENNFEPKYVIPTKAKKRVADLKKLSSEADKLILATDEDREGEAIAWHLTQALGLNTVDQKQLTSDKSKVKGQKLKVVERIAFHEITERAVKEALNNPRAINEKLVDAQQARRILDRLVGYKLSPFLWKKVARGLSAGRVQSVAVRLVVEREREIEKFKPEEYHTISALLQKLSPFGRSPAGREIPNEFTANLVKIGDEKLEKFSIKNTEEAAKIVASLQKAEWRVEQISSRALNRQPLPPFTTSTLQQAAFSRFGFGAKQTMVIAQQLYETGLITYMRTDSVNLSTQSIEAAREKILADFGKDYLLPSARVYKTKSKSAQEAHEAIRPTTPGNDPASLKAKLDPGQTKLYDLIWRRFMATQMPNAVFEATTVDIAASAFGPRHIFRANGNVLKFDGFLKVYTVKTAETILPALEEKEKLQLKDLKSEQHFTEPSARYNEASLIKALEEHGIGRPSTYAPTMATIQDRRYVLKDEQKRLRPTDIGILVNDLLVKHFPDIVDIGFTAAMEEDLDAIAEGKKAWRPVIKMFWEPFKKNLDKKTEELSKKEIAIEATDIKCPECGKPVIIRMGRFGKFYACTGFPECKYTATVEKKEGEKPEDLGPCPKCNEGKIVRKRTKKYRTFWGCSRWPKCDWATWENPQKNPAPETPENKEGSEEP